MKKLLAAGVILFSVVALPKLAAAQMTLPTVNIGLKSTNNPQEIVSAIKIVLMLTVLTLAPGDFNHDDVLHAHHYRAFVRTPSAGNATNATESAARRACAVFDHVYHGAVFQ